MNALAILTLTVWLTTVIWAGIAARGRPRIYRVYASPVEKVDVDPGRVKELTDWNSAQLALTLCHAELNCHSILTRCRIFLVLTFVQAGVISLLL
ncbi:MAG: hypothetical protein OXH70_17330 [Acidobacteria bacterium]|nr:hypothetical protein [Acidobacteriota bacterium]